MTKDEIIEAEAKRSFEAHSRALTGHAWVWSVASENIKTFWRKQARKSISFGSRGDFDIQADGM